MLAREMRIKNIKRQREFIKKQLSTVREDGVTSFPFVGYIFPEVTDYFREEGYLITPVKSDILCAITRGQPVHLFTINDDDRHYRSLSEEEKKQVEEYQDPEPTADESTCIMDIIKKSLSEF